MEIKTKFKIGDIVVTKNNYIFKIKGITIDANNIYYYEEYEEDNYEENYLKIYKETKIEELKDKEIEELKQQLLEKEKIITEYEKKDSYALNIGGLQKIIKEKNKEIEELKTRLKN